MRLGRRYAGRVLTNKRENDSEQGCGREGDMRVHLQHLQQINCVKISTFCKNNELPKQSDLLKGNQ